MIDAFLRGLESIFAWLIEASWQASVLVALVLLLHLILRSRLNPRWHHTLWLLVIARLLLPYLPESAFSIFQFAPSPPPVVTETVTAPIFNALPVPAAGTPLLPAPPAAYPFSAFTVLALVWLAGALALLILTWQVNRRFARHVAVIPPVTDPRLLKLAESAQQELGLHRRLRIIESSRVQSPAIMGLFRPSLILPKDVRARFADAELRFIFLHEFAHLKRGDLFLQWLVALLQILHWFNPVLWYAFRRMRADREPATDALVLSCTGETCKESYGQVLVKLLEHYHQHHSLPTLIGILEDKDQFKRRFTLIARFNRTAYGWSLLGVTIIAILSIMCLTKSKATESQDTAQPNPPPALTAAKTLLEAKMDTAARRVLLTQLQSMPDDQFVGMLQALGGTDPNFTALDIKISDENVQIAGLLANGYTPDHPKIVAITNKVASLQEDRKRLADGMRRALVIDLQAADARASSLVQSAAPTSTDLHAQILLAREDADACHVLLDKLQPMPDDQFVATLLGLGRADPIIIDLDKKIAQENSAIANLLNDGFTNNHPRIVSMRAEIAARQVELKRIIDGVRHAMALDLEMADSRVALLQKEVDNLNAQTSPLTKR